MESNNNLNDIATQVITQADKSKEKIHKSMEALEGSKQLKHINKYVSRKCKHIKRDIKGEQGVAKGKYTKLGLYVSLSDHYDHLKSYLKRKITEGEPRTNWLKYVKKCLNEIKLNKEEEWFGAIGWTNKESKSYTELDKKILYYNAYREMFSFINIIANLTAEEIQTTQSIDWDSEAILQNVL